jgi:hypothetical protein
MQGIEIRIAVNAQDDGLAVNHEMLLAVPQRSFNDPRISLGPIVSAASNQPHPIAVALNTQTVAVELDLVKPVGARGNLDSASG